MNKTDRRWLAGWLVILAEGDGLGRWNGKKGGGEIEKGGRYDELMMKGESVMMKK